MKYESMKCSVLIHWSVSRRSIFFPERSKGMKETKKLKIAVIFGGVSSEYEVSLQSAYAVITNMDREKYEPVLIGITREGCWLYFTGDCAKIREDTWHRDAGCIPAALSPNPGGELLLPQERAGVRRIAVDAVLPVLHGKNGEDGTLQGLIELAGIPLIGCGTLASALCMDKDRAHKLVQAMGIRVAKSLVIDSLSDMGHARMLADYIGYPLYVKPVKAGSSYGITRVTDAGGLERAAALAFTYDNQVIFEENIEGFEVGCAVLGNRDLIVGEVDEIELSQGFFDYTEKYTLKSSRIHVPARISKKKAEEIKETGKAIYRILGCSGFARVDMFLTPKGDIVFNEVNTIPGFTEHSRYPKMMEAAGYSFPTLLDKLIDCGMGREKQEGQIL